MKNYVNYNANPEGRDTQDCFIRAMVKITGKTWEQEFDIICKMARLLHIAMVDERIADLILGSEAFTKLDPQVTRVHDVNSFAEEYKTGKYILIVNHHAVAVVDGKYYDKKDTGRRKVIDAYKFTKA